MRRARVPLTIALLALALGSCEVEADTLPAYPPDWTVGNTYISWTINDTWRCSRPCTTEGDTCRCLLAECPPGQHLGPADKDDHHRECVPDRPKAKPPKCAPCDLCAPPTFSCPPDCPDCICNPTPPVIVPCDICDCAPCEAANDRLRQRLTEPATKPGRWITLAGLSLGPTRTERFSYFVQRDPSGEIDHDSAKVAEIIHGYVGANGWGIAGKASYEFDADDQIRWTHRPYGAKALTVESETGGWGFGVYAVRMWGTR